MQVLFTNPCINHVDYRQILHKISKLLKTSSQALDNGRNADIICLIHFTNESVKILKFKVFIDGAEGTTGLQLRTRLSAHGEISLLEIDPDLRKDPSERRKLINQSDVTFLCLPDAAAKEAVGLCENPDTVIIDASTAHRTAPGWVYGFPELSEDHRKAIAAGKRIANPGCHATGFIAAVYPLIKHGVAPKDYPFTCHSVTGYSGGGKKMIAQYEDESRAHELDSPRQYGLGLNHKHLPEMQVVTGISEPPVFNPIVADFYSGMCVSVPLVTRLLNKKVTPEELIDIYAEHYSGSSLISVHPAPDSGFLPANDVEKTCRLKIFVMGNAERITVAAVFDNLGKGASGAAVQNMNIALGIGDTAYLEEGDRLL